MHAIKKAEYIYGYRLRLYFTNKEVRIINLEEDLKNSENMFRDLLDIDYFKKVKRVGDSIAWPNGIDYCPDWLYMHSKAESKPSVKKRPVRRKIRSRKNVRKKRVVV